MIPANGALGASADRDRPERRRQGIIGQKPVGQKIALSEKDLQNLGGLEGADHAGNHPQDPRLGTGGNRSGGRWLPEEAPIAGRFSGQDGQDLTNESQYSSMDEGFSGDDRQIVDQELGREDIRFRDGLDTKIQPGDEVSIIPAIAGGAK